MTRKQHRQPEPPHAASPAGIPGTALLLYEIASLRTQLSAARLRAANLEAAMRAALSAHCDGETDPLSYLRDEIIPFPGGRHDA